MSSLFDPDPAPVPRVVRTLCLATRWYDDDPMPHVCALKDGHDGDHGTKPWGGAAGEVGAVWWANDEQEEVA